jgi:hypothetical protein
MLGTHKLVGQANGFVSAVADHVFDTWRKFGFHGLRLLDTNITFISATHPVLFTIYRLILLVKNSGGKP